MKKILLTLALLSFLPAAHAMEHPTAGITAYLNRICPEPYLPRRSPFYTAQVLRSLITPGHYNTEETREAINLLIKLCEANQFCFPEASKEIIVPRAYQQILEHAGFLQPTLTFAETPQQITLPDGDRIEIDSPYFQNIPLQYRLALQRTRS